MFIRSRFRVGIQKPLLKGLDSVVYLYPPTPVGARSLCNVQASAHSASSISTAVYWQKLKRWVAWKFPKPGWIFVAHLGLTTLRELLLTVRLTKISCLRLRTAGCWLQVEGWKFRATLGLSGRTWWDPTPKAGGISASCKTPRPRRFIA